MNSKLDEYRRKRDFSITAEPDEQPLRKRRGKSALSFVIQKHAARRLHYDFRLELDGTLKSWAVPKGPSLDPRDKRLAVHVEDHPLDYGSFEGSIPAGQYGAGDVIVWDRGIWQPHGDPRTAYQSGKLKFSLQGEKLGGDWTLVRTHLRGSGDKEQWLLIKERDQQARSADDYNIVEALPGSVLSEASIPAKPAKPTQAAPREKPPRSGVPLPDMLKPALATLVDRPPSGDWRYEIKFDGYRILARKQGREVRLLTRNGNDWTERLPQQAKALAALDVGDSWLDGEVVVLGDNGLPDFQALQNAFDRNLPKDIIFYLFDAPFLHGEDLRDQPVEARRAALKAVMGSNRSPALRFSEDFSAAPQDIIESACALKLEGIIGKRVGSTYVARRTPDWIKLKCRLRQEFVIIGFTKPKGSRSGFGALLLGVHEQGDLHYAGRVGTGFSETRLRELHDRLKRLERKTPAAVDPPTGAEARDVHWVKPELVAEVEFAEWTREGVVRQASFVALRSDKPAQEIGHETPQPAESIEPQRNDVAMHRAGKAVVAGVSISNPQRIIDPESGGRKLDLARFYADIADWILPFLNDRPVSLVRAPDGVEGEQFFQKHAEKLSIPNIRHLDPSLDPDHPRLMEIDSLKALIGAVQMGTIELHTWGATDDAIETPDLFVLDLDPDPALPWRTMQEAAQLCLSVLDELGLDAYLKTSGGKGLHIIVPLKREAGWDVVKAFSKAFARFMAHQLPDRFSATSGPRNRVGKIFIDYLRNNRGSSTVCAYSVRARPSLPVSVPIARDELHDLHSAAQWTIFNLRDRLDALNGNPWDGYANRQTLTPKMWKQLGAKPPRT
ncbi:DNA ligase D [Pseudomonas flexibilis]|uniref:DNA ligase (ATP) n=1 Tax=Pseudomonas flexibilis TaxID=706570 RepID=A0A0B3BIA3_9PSED|nr:DNA ligase D [Pseudomonas flexibilis]KHO64188.1 ATP-dependent DNA ligase [Pseudomonas flexibilis]SCY15185.1 bifunctional non-homologous end joining protein LigD [Pseudomonas flexibilis]